MLCHLRIIISDAVQTQMCLHYSFDPVRSQFTTKGNDNNTSTKLLLMVEPPILPPLSDVKGYESDSIASRQSKYSR